MELSTENMIYYDDWYNKLTIQETNVTDYSNALLLLFKTTQDCVTFINTEKITIAKNDFIKDDDGYYYYKHRVSRDCDIIDNIKINSSNNDLKIKYYVNGHYIDMDEILLFLMIYNDCDICIKVLEKPIMDVDVTIQSRKYLIHNNSSIKNMLEKKVLDLKNPQKLLTKKNTYMCGMCGVIM